MPDNAPFVAKEDVFENRYTATFKALVIEHGWLVHYDSDRAAIDLGLHLTVPGRDGDTFTHSRIWFQLKGIHSSSLSLAEFSASSEVKLSLRVSQLKFWFASPEPIYLAVYIECADLFLVEDVRDIVYRRWGETLLNSTTIPPEQAETTVAISSSAVLGGALLANMRRHQSMRIDGPYFRGLPLGHRLDPLRCSLKRLDPTAYMSVVSRVLDVHGYRIESPHDPAQLFAASASVGSSTSLTTGVLFNTLEWVFHMTTQFGVSSDDEFREEGKPLFAQGPVAVFVDGDPSSHPARDRLHEFARRLEKNDIEQFLVFLNTAELGFVGSFRHGVRETAVRCMPHLLPELAYNLLTAPVVYLEFREAITWEWVNYL